MNFSIESIVWVCCILFLIVITFQTIEMKTLENEFIEQKKVFFISESLVSKELATRYNGYYKKCYLGLNKIDDLLNSNYNELIEKLDVENIKITINEKSIGYSKNKAKITRYCNCEGVPCEITVEI